MYEKYTFDIFAFVLAGIRFRSMLQYIHLFQNILGVLLSVSICQKILHILLNQVHSE